MSFSGTKVCAAPPGPAAELVCGARASGVYPVEVGLAGFTKSGPAVHPASRSAVKATRKGERVDMVLLAN